MRRSHRKSRTGCLNCKQRRIKCDEQDDPCLNCIARHVTCKYEGGYAARHYRETSRATTISSQAEHLFSTRSINTVGPIIYHRNTTELELLHIWYGHTYASFTPTMSEQYFRINEAWKVQVVQEAFKFDFLLPAILALAALHQSRLLNNTCQIRLQQHYGLLALKYQQEASYKFRKGLKFINQDNHIAVLSFAVLNMGISLGTLSFEHTVVDTRATAHFILERLKTVFHMMQGLLMITETAQPWLNGGPFQSTRYLTQQGDHSYPNENTRTAFSALLEYAQQSDAASRGIGFAMSVRQLERCFIAPVSLGNSICLLWPSFVPPTFLRALEADEPAALLVVMFWGALLHRMEDKKWWIAHAGTQIVGGVNRLLLLADDPRIASLKVWPLQQLLRGPEEGITLPGASQATSRYHEGLIAASLCMI